MRSRPRFSTSLEMTAHESVLSLKPYRNRIVDL